MVNTGLFALWAWVFVALGLTFSILGPALPELRAEFSLPLTSAGLVFVMHSAGYFAGVLLGGTLADTRGRKFVVGAGSILLSTGMGIASVAPAWALVLAAIVVAGVGFSFVDIGLNAAIGEAFTGTGKRAAILNLLHAAFPVGTLVAPSCLALALQAGLSWRSVFAATALAAACSLLGFRRGSMEWPVAHEIPTPRASASPAEGVVSLARLLRQPRLRMLALMQGLYVCAEVAMASWIATYLVERFGVSPSTGAFATAAYWGAFLVGRPAVAWLAHRVDPHRLLPWLCVTGAAAGVAGVLAPSALLAAVAYVVAGFAICGIFPTVLALAIEGQTETTGSTSALIMGAASLGGLLWPWLVGAVAQWVSLRPAMALAVAPVVALAVLSNRTLHPAQATATTAAGAALEAARGARLAR